MNNNILQIILYIMNTNTLTIIFIVNKYILSITYNINKKHINYYI